MSRAAALAALFAALLAFAAPSDASRRTTGAAYVIVDLGTLGGSTSAATAINSSGWVVGYAATSGDSASHAFLWRHGVMTDLGTLPGGRSSHANGISDRGQVVGWSDALVSSPTAGAVVAPQAFLYSRGTLTDIDPNAEPSSTPGSWAYGINNAGQVVGDVLAPSGDVRAFRYGAGSFATLAIAGDEPQARSINSRGAIVGSTFVDMSPPFLFAGGAQQNLGSVRGQAEAINSNGEVAGWTQSMGSPMHAFLSRGSAMTDLGTLGGPTSQANALNGEGQVVGSSDVAAGAAHAFLYRRGVMVDLNRLVPADSGWLLENATGVNARGEIVGVGSVDGARHAFLLVPKALRSRANA